MKNKLPFALLSILSFALAGCAQSPAVSSSLSTEAVSSSPSASSAGDLLVNDMIGRSLTIKPGSYRKVVCIGAGALRLYSYVGDVSLLSGVEDIDNDTLASRPKMFDGVARPYFIANKDVFAKLPSCGVGGPNAQARRSGEDSFLRARYRHLRV